MTQPWYTYPMDAPGTSYGQAPEPLNPSYLKPDVNIAVPSGTPITALLPGTITDVSNRGYSAGGLSVTEKLTNALNRLAQYMSFNYLGTASVYKGEPIAAGQQIGTAGSPTGINFALALGSDPVWGGGPGFQQNAVGNPLLNPTNLLKNAKAGQPLNTCNCPPLYTDSGQGSCVSLIPGFPEIPCGSTQSPEQQAGQYATQNTVLGQVGHILQNLTTPDFWIRFGIGVGAILLILFGLFIFVKDSGPAQQATQAAKVAAVAA